MALPFRIRLWHKGVALVSLLLAVELVLLLAMTKLLGDAEREAAVAEHAERISRKANQLCESYVKLGTSLAAYSAMPNRKFEKAINLCAEEIPILFKDLRELLQDDPAAVKVLDDLEPDLLACDKALVEAKKGVDEGNGIDERMLRRQVITPVKRIATTLRSISEANQNITETMPMQASRTRAEMKRVIAFGLLANIILAFLMSWFFIRHINNKLSRLADNSARLARGLTLHPVLEGTDEISNLDRVFHDMAQALDEAARSRRTIIENMPVGLVGFDSSGIIQTVNPRTEQMFKLSAEELIGRHVMSLFAKAVRGESADKFMQELHNRCLHRIAEFKAENNNGEIFPVEVSMNEFATEGGDRYLASMLDITERHEVERLKREFVAMVSHDLRTPLTSVEASLTLMAAGALGDIPQEALDTVKIAESEIVRLRALVNDLLDVAKIEAGKMDMSFDEIDLDEVVEQSISAVGALAAERKIQIEYATTDAMAIADGNRMVQVLVNFLSNALKYSPEGGKISVQINSTADWHEVRVTDQGPGIAPEYHEVIFQRFGQAKSSEQKEGTGLGLAICKTIIDQHGGTIGLDSEAGKGSSFWFRLPCSKSEQPSFDSSYMILRG